MKRQLYFRNTDSEFCHPAEYFLDECDEIEVLLAEREKVGGIFWCNEHQFCGNNSQETCGKECNEYEPRNGRSGCCRHYSTVFYTHGEKVTLKEDK